MLLRALRDAAERGVRVRLLLDDLYTGGNDPLLLGLAAHPNVEIRLFNPFMVRFESVGARVAASLFDFGRVNHRMHNKLFIADGAMAVAGGRNIGDEYFMAHQGANYIDLDVFAVGAVLPTLAGLFDQYWNSEHVFPLEAIVPPDEPAEERRRRFEQATLAPGGPTLPGPGNEGLGSACPGSPRSSAAGRLDLIWAKAEAFADSPDKVIGHSTRVLGKPREHRPDRAPEPDDRAAAGAARRGDQLALPGARPLGDGRHHGGAALEPADHARSPTRWRRPTSRWCTPATSATAPRCSTSAFACTRWRRAGSSAARTSARSASRSAASMPRRRRSTASCMFIGSLNFDPRSEKHNTELGLLIHSPELTGQLLQLAELVISEAAYQVRLGPDRKSLEWHIRTDEGEQIFTEEPDTSWWQRTMLHLVGPFVPEGQL